MYISKCSINEWQKNIKHIWSDYWLICSTFISKFITCILPDFQNHKRHRFNKNELYLELLSIVHSVDYLYYWYLYSGTLEIDMVVLWLHQNLILDIYIIWQCQKGPIIVQNFESTKILSKYVYKLFTRQNSRNLYQTSSEQEWLPAEFSVQYRCKKRAQCGEGWRP